MKHRTWHFTYIVFYNFSSPLRSVLTPEANEVLGSWELCSKMQVWQERKCIPPSHCPPLHITAQHGPGGLSWFGIRKRAWTDSVSGDFTASSSHETQVGAGVPSLKWPMWHFTKQSFIVNAYKKNWQSNPVRLAQHIAQPNRNFQVKMNTILAEQAGISFVRKTRPVHAMWIVQLCENKTN